MSNFADSATVERLLEERRRERLSGNPVMQCKVCWYVYNPEEGCPENETLPGTPFSELPDWWCCPHCGAARDTFLVAGDDLQHGGQN